MPPHWTDASKANRVIDFLKGILGVNDDGDVTLGIGTDFDAGVATLAGLTRLSDEIPERDRRRIVRRSLIEAKKADDLASDRVLNEIRNRQGEFLQQPEKPYVLLTSLSIKYFDDLATVRPYGATITFTRNPPNRFKLSDVAKQASKTYKVITPRRFTAVRVHVHARNESDAVEKALNRLDFVRGLWNLALTYGRYRITLGIGHKPVHPILKGPIHTLHNPNGSPTSDSAWWQPNYPRNISPTNIRSKYDAIKKTERYVRKRLAKSNFEDTLVNLLIQYTYALDETDLRSSFLKLWAILETLTDASGKAVVNRATMLFKHRDYRSLVLHQLRSERNRMVHEGHETEEAENLVYELKKYVDSLLTYLIEYVQTWDSISDYGLFLAIPKDLNEVKKRRDYHDLAIELLSSAYAAVNERVGA